MVIKAVIFGEYMRKEAIFLEFIFAFFLTSIHCNSSYAINDPEVEGLINKLFLQTKDERSQQEYKKLYSSLKPLAEAGDPDARYYLSMFYSGGLGGVKADVDYAYQMMRELAEEGYARAQYAIGFEYEMGSVYGKPDNEKALYWYKKASESGFWLAMNRLIAAYENGELGLKADPEMAALLKLKKEQPRESRE